MKRLIAILFAALLFLCGCSKNEEIVPYDLAVCDADMVELCDYIDDFENENYKVEKIEFTDDQFSGLIASLSEIPDGLNSITFYSEKISNEMAQQIISFAEPLNIPVIFAFSEISNDVLTSYDTAFVITTNYTHAAEITAEKINDLWDSGTIIDADENMIFTFAVVKDEELSDNMQSFYETLIAGIELYGVPMQINSDISPTEIASGESLVAFNENNEALIVIDKTAFSYINEYTPYSSGIEIITITENYENALSESGFALNCFVNYQDYKLAADEIIRNFNNRQFPLIDLSFPYEERTIYIPATV